jgi:hypothetical protein
MAVVVRARGWTVAVVWRRGTAEGAGAEGADAGREGMDWDGGRAEGIDGERMGADAACNWPVRGLRMGRFVRARGTGRVRVQRRGGGIAMVYTIVLIDSRDKTSVPRI